MSREEKLRDRTFEVGPESRGKELNLRRPETDPGGRIWCQTYKRVPSFDPVNTPSEKRGKEPFVRRSNGDYRSQNF